MGEVCARARRGRQWGVEAASVVPLRGAVRLMEGRAPNNEDGAAQLGAVSGVLRGGSGIFA